MAKKDVEPLPYYRWYWRDWRASRAVQRMSWQARGLYRELLDECWVSGSFADNLDTMADICGTEPDTMATYWVQIKPQFHKRGRRWYNERIERERNKADELRATKALAGKKSAEARGDRKSTDVEHPLTDVEQPSTSSSSAVHMQSISSSSSSAVRSSRRAALAPQRARGALTPVVDILKVPKEPAADEDWRTALRKAGAEPS